MSDIQPSETSNVPVKPRINWIKQKPNDQNKNKLKSIKPIVTESSQRSSKPVVVDELNTKTVKSLPIEPTHKVTKSLVDQVDKPKLTDYRCYNASDIRPIYVQLLNDNLQHLIEYIYANTDKDAYKSASTRVALAMQMILASNQLIPYQISSLIAKDIEELKKNDDYINQWENPTLKRKALTKELEFLKKHTEIDETMSLNLTDKPGEEENKLNLKDFDIHSGVSTLNVSSRFPVETSPAPGCLIM